MVTGSAIRSLSFSSPPDKDSTTDSLRPSQLVRSKAQARTEPKKLHSVTSARAGGRAHPFEFWLGPWLKGPSQSGHPGWCPPLLPSLSGSTLMHRHPTFSHLAAFGKPSRTAVAPFKIMDNHPNFSTNLHTTGSIKFATVR